MVVSKFLFLKEVNDDETMRGRLCHGRQEKRRPTDERNEDRRISNWRYATMK